MSDFETFEMTFLHRNVFSFGNSNGGIAVVHVTVWQDKTGRVRWIPDDPAQLPLLKKLMRMEKPDA